MEMGLGLWVSSRLVWVGLPVHWAKVFSVEGADSAEPCAGEEVLDGR